jgi:hypothetical protein
MVNDKFYQRICTFIANTYGLNPDRVWQAYEKIGSIDSLINLAKDGTFDKIEKINE